MAPTTGNTENTGCAGRFRDKSTGVSFLVFNTHLDHMGKEARKHSASLILEKIDSINGEDLPVILMGDMNAPPESEPVQVFLGRFGGASAMELETGTFNGFNPSHGESIRIDYIFAGGGLIMGSTNIIRELTDGRFPSDHFPVVADVTFSP